MQISVAQFKRFSIAVFITAATFLVLPNVNAITPSPAMLEQFKTLPKSQQEKLMKQYGISPDMLGALGGTGFGGEAQTLENPVIMNERGTSVTKSSQSNDNNLYSKDADEIKRYGYDMFEGEPTTFAPVTDVPVPAEYLMGPGDVVNVSIYGKVNESFSLTVSRLGSIELPNSGPMSINGLTFETLQKKLSAKINEQYTGINSSVSLGELRSIRVIIAGESYKPGSYTVSSLSTITQALFVSGGVSDIASLRNIQLKRAGKNIVTFDLYDLLMKGDATKDARLQSGDVIFIPPVAKTVTVLGEVRRPAIYELKGNETAKDLVKLAAGLNANSFPKASVIERFSSDYLPTLINVDLTTNNGKATFIRDGDVLTVQSTTENIKNQVLVAGAVSRPGFYQWRSGMRVSDLIASQWSDLNDNVDLKYALLTREINLQGDIKTMQFSLANIFNDKNSKDNLQLESRDTIVVFNKTDTVAEILLKEKREEMRLLHEGLSTMNPEYLERQELEELDSRGSRDSRDSEEESEKSKKQRFSRNEDVSEKENEYDEDLARLYQDKELLKRSGEFTRRALLTPIINKLKTQDLIDNVTYIASVAGAVKFPGEYPISSNAKVSDLVNAAGGLKESAHRKQAELTKFSIDDNLGASVSHHKVALDLALKNHSDANLKIGSRDQLTVLQIPAWQDTMTVSILGEVKFPGEYSVREGETLENVVKRAGGYKQQAFLNGSVFTRESVKEKELEQIQKFTDQLRSDIVTKNLSNGSGISFSEASLMLKELENITPIGRMVISLSKESNNSHNQLLVEDGDMLFIPLKKQTVTVVGEVQHASTHFYEETNDFDDYIRLAGGIKQRADDDRIYIIQANGAVVLPEKSLWFNAGGDLKPGDTIVVPLDTEYKDKLGLWSTITGIMSNAAVAFSVINN